MEFFCFIYLLLIIELFLILSKFVFGLKISDKLLGRKNVLRVLILHKQMWSAMRTDMDTRCKDLTISNTKKLSNLQHPKDKSPKNPIQLTPFSRFSSDPASPVSPVIPALPVFPVNLEIPVPAAHPARPVQRAPKARPAIPVGMVIPVIPVDRVIPVVPVNPVFVRNTVLWMVACSFRMALGSFRSLK